MVMGPYNERSLCNATEKYTVIDMALQMEKEHKALELAVRTNKTNLK